MPESPARHLNLAGASNFRDLGGYAGKDGRLVRWRQIFRSNHLGHLTADDVAMLRRLGVKSAFDFRGREERNAALCGVDEIEVHSLPVEPTVVATLRAIFTTGRTPTADDARRHARLLSRLRAAEHAAVSCAVCPHCSKTGRRW